jgi:hypothetical protein
MRRGGVSGRVVLCIAVFACFVLVVAAAGHKPPPKGTHQGLYLGGEGAASEMNSFTPCGDTAFLWVDGDARLVQRLRRAQARVSSSPFRPVYIEVSGRRIERGSARLEDYYHGIMHIDTVFVVKDRSPPTCRPMPLRPDGSQGRRFPF